MPVGKLIRFHELGVLACDANEAGDGGSILVSAFDFTDEIENLQVGDADFFRCFADEGGHDGFPLLTATAGRGPEVGATMRHRVAAEPNQEPSVTDDKRRRADFGMTNGGQAVFG